MSDDAKLAWLEAEFPFSVLLPSERSEWPSVEQWLHFHCEGAYMIGEKYCRFANRSDAVRFVMRWN